MSRTSVVIALAVTSIIELTAQTPPKPAFDVASIKVNDSGGPIRVANIQGGFRATNISVQQLIVRAYDVRDFQIAGGPGWMASDRFDVDAKVESGRDVTPELVGLMLQDLLADRFQLKAHQQKRELPAYELTIGKNGHKMRPAATTTAVAPTKVPTDSFDPATMPPPGSLRMTGNGHMAASAMSLEQLVRSSHRR